MSCRIQPALGVVFSFSSMCRNVSGELDTDVAGFATPERAIVCSLVSKDNPERLLDMFMSSPLSNDHPDFELSVSIIMRLY